MNDQYANLLTEYSLKASGYFETERRELLGFVPRDTRSVLDVGCGGGGFGALLKTNRPGIEVWGIEPQIEAANEATTKLDQVINNIFAGNLEQLQGRTFDLISFNDVLEHLVKPESALDTAKSFLSPGGLILASVPNILHFHTIWRILREQDWRYEDSGIMDNTHLRFFTKKSILRMFESSGFTVVQIEGINPNYSFKFSTLNFLSGRRFEDWKFEQFVVLARAE